MPAVQLNEAFAFGDDGISRRDFKRLADYIHGCAGIKLPPTKITMVEGRLRRRLRALGLPSFAAYCGFLFELGGLESEAVYLLNALTTNKTDFFREPTHFDYLSRKVLPDLAASGVREVRAWSAACSTGAEPYTMAMVMDEAFAERSVAYRILATDLSTEVLQAGRRGVYPDEVLTPIPTAFRARYVMAARDRSRREGRIVPRLRSRIGFARLNLMDAAYPVDAFDIIFCRNVLIYFDKATQLEVLTKLCSHLRPGGHLFLGHSESITGMPLPVRQVGNTVFQGL